MVPIERFVTAQADPVAGFDAALAELRSGRKRGHWIWYVFPQLAGLGSSAQSRFYGLAEIGEAVEYLKHPLLGARLTEATTAVVEQIRKGVALSTLMGSPIDLMKLVSSLTLFESAAARVYEREGSEAHGTFTALADEVLMAAFAEGHPRCQRTLASLRRESGPRDAVQSSERGE
jgi:uncharacterized protein (DUF1810 family)